MDYKDVLNGLLDVVGVAGVVTGHEEVRVVTEVLSKMLEDDLDNKEFLRGLTDDEIRQLLYSAKEELYNRRK